MTRRLIWAGCGRHAEQMLLLARLWKALGIRGVELHVNSIGDAADRKAHRGKLIDYFERHAALLDDDARRRLHAGGARPARASGARSRWDRSWPAGSG